MGVLFPSYGKKTLGIGPFAEVEAKLQSLNGDLSDSEVQFIFQINKTQIWSLVE